MKPICENRFTITKELFYEGTLRISRDGYGKSARKYSLIFLGVWAAMALGLLYTGGSLGQILFTLILVGAICLWLNVLAPRSHAKRGWTNMVGRNGTALERRTCFYRDRLEVSGDCETKVITYYEILQIQESKNLLIIITVDKTGVMLAKNGFVTGDANTVRDLIRG